MDYIDRRTRIIALLLSVVAVVLLHKWLGGNWLPTDSSTTLIFQNILLMIVLGTALVESKFTKPSDAVVNALAVILTLISVRDPAQFIAWRLNLVFALAVALVGLFSILVGDESKAPDVFANRIARLAYALSTFFGKARLIFSVSFVLSVFSFYQSQQREFLILMLFWAFIVSAEPSGLLLAIQRFFTKSSVFRGIGRVSALHLPRLVQFAPFQGQIVNTGDYVLIRLEKYHLAAVIESSRIGPEASTRAVSLATFDEIDWRGPQLQRDDVAFIGKIEELEKLLPSHKIIEKCKRFVGIMVENSSIGELIFRMTSSVRLEEGNVIEAEADGQQVLYQVVNAKSGSGDLEKGMKISHVTGIAQQVGVWNPGKVRFDKFGWIPPVHAPLYLIDKSYEVKSTLSPNEIILGYIPNTNFPIIANVDALISHHTAILGITGSGKTEMAFTLISKMVDLKTKVFCVDFTGDYYAEFKDLDPEKLTISTQRAMELNERLLAVETGQYGATKEIGELEKFKGVLVPEIKELVEKFITSDKNLGVFELSEIANTSATIAITEYYLSQIFAYARKHRGDGRKYCIVLEEAHTVIPESQTMGVQDKFSRATISKISQIALQGRKYSVGLLVIAQRTANVTKTVLNQCNSIIVFNSYDKTGFDFLENYVGPGMISAIPNLKFLHGMVVGRGFKAGRPLIMSLLRKEKFASQTE